MEIKYINSREQELLLSEWPIAVTNITELYGHAWTADAKANKRKSRSKVRYFFRTEISKHLNVSIYADSEEEYKELVNSMNDIIDYDVINNSPGKLYCGEYYLRCFLQESNPSEYEELFYTIDTTLVVYSPEPFWIKEKKYKWIAGKETLEQSYLNFHYDFPYNYSQNAIGNAVIINDTVSNCDFRLVIYGTVTNPYININGVIRQIFYEVENNAYIVIDTRDSTIIYVDPKGKKANIFGYRDTSVSIFELIPPGYISVSWSGAFGAELTLFESRSEPKW